MPSCAAKKRFALLLLRGDHELNEIKANKVIGEFRFAKDDEIVAALGCKPGYIGPIKTTLSYMQTVPWLQ